MDARQIPQKLEGKDEGRGEADNLYGGSEFLNEPSQAGSFLFLALSLSLYKPRNAEDTKQNGEAERENCRARLIPSAQRKLDGEDESINSRRKKNKTSAAFLGHVDVLVR